MLLIPLLFSSTGFSQDVSITPLPDPASGIRDQASGTGQPGFHPGNWVLVIHGGAGGPPQGSMSEEQEQAYKDKLNEALAVGTGILEKGGSSMEAVEAVVMFMEDCPLFNAGKGAVYNDEGYAEMDASIMDGSTLMAGAVTGVTTIRHPVSAARLVMTETRHVLLMCEGADLFAQAQGLEMVDRSYFQTPARTKQYERMKEQQRSKSDTIKEKKDSRPDTVSMKDDNTKGTVGAVALDNMGNLAAATSTGGLMMKMKGRIGDTPIIGAGTYANNATCAVSCTGTGEYFMRNVIAYDVSALMEYRDWSLEEATNYLIRDKLKSQGGGGGLIAVDKDGNIAMPFNTNAMFRGYAKAKEGAVVEIYP
ncbi:MAG: isoaspartyl peptidase/L-asparaginase [Bacteroidales bacterium]|nr:isoaspartyl peptidase/L-asparaginase [Bacteroidales bacterium]